jgi:hypothetical protein
MDDVDAVGVGESEVEDEEVGLLVLGGVEGGGAVGGGDDVELAGLQSIRSARRIWGSSSKTRTRIRWSPPPARGPARGAGR